MQYDPVVVGVILVLHESRGVGRRDERAGSALVLGADAVRDHHVLETGCLAYIVVLSWKLASGTVRTGFLMLTFGRLIPGKIMLEQYASAANRTSVYATPQIVPIPYRGGS